MRDADFYSIPLRRKVLFLATAILLGLVAVFAVAELAARSIAPRSDPVKVGIRLPDSPRLFGLVPNHRSLQTGVPVQTNSLGFREREYPVERAPEVVRIAVLGDSYTFGTGVPFEEIFSKRLEKHLNTLGVPSEVVNFGVPGYNTALELETWREVASRFKADLVILGYVLNDVERYGADSAQADGVSKRSLVNAAHKNLKDASMLYRYAAPKLGAAAAVLFGDRYALGGTNQIIRSFEEGAPGWIESREALRTLADEVRQAGASFMVVVFPMMLDFSTYPLPDAHRRIVRFCREQGIDVIDLLPALAKRDVGRLTVVMDGHPNGRAHELFAERIFTHLRDRHQPLPPSAAQ